MSAKKQRKGTVERTIKSTQGHASMVPPRHGHAYGGEAFPNAVATEISQPLSSLLFNVVLEMIGKINRQGKEI